MNLVYYHGLHERIRKMQQGKGTFFKIFKIAIVVLAFGNLAALFLFQYELPDLLLFKKETAQSEENPPTEPEEEVSEDIQYSIQLDTDTLTYDGTTELNLLEGVSLVSSDGTVSDNTIFAHIKTGNSLSKKVIEYSADTPDGQITTSRSLELNNYNGPSISLPDPLPQLEEDELDSMLSSISGYEDFYADDGYGNDITDAVSVSYTMDDNEPSQVLYTFTVTNTFNDSISVEAYLTLSDTRPVIILTENTVTIPIHSSFNGLNYVESARDIDGSSLFDRIHIVGDVDVDTAGTYVLTYSITTRDGVASLPKELTVIVE